MHLKPLLIGMSKYNHRLAFKQQGNLNVSPKLQD